MITQTDDDRRFQVPDRLTAFHAIEESIKGGAKGTLLYSRGGGRRESITSLAHARGCQVRKVSEDEITELCGDREHRGMVFLPSEWVKEKGGRKIEDLRQFIGFMETRENVVVLALDQITDPHNLGAILRSADQFAADLVLTTKRRSAHVGDTVLRTSAGSSVYVPHLEVTNLPRSLESLKDAGFWTYGADMAGEPAYERDLRGRVVLVLGSEGRGLGRLVGEQCDALISIPAFGRIDSLNVSVAAGILLYEVRRQAAVSAEGEDPSG